MTEAAWVFNGGKITVIQGLEDSNEEFQQWCLRLIEFILRVAGSADFRVEDNGYQRFPGVFVTGGVTSYFKDEPFEVWSDVPGEIILRHESMGFRLGRELLDRLEKLWRAMEEDERASRR